VILIAATNRPDVLDPALLATGRFDRQVWCRIRMSSPETDPQGARPQGAVARISTSRPLPAVLPGFRCRPDEPVHEAALTAARVTSAWSPVEFEEARTR